MNLSDISKYSFLSSLHMTWSFSQRLNMPSGVKHTSFVYGAMSRLSLSCANAPSAHTTLNHKIEGINPVTKDTEERSTKMVQHWHSVQSWAVQFLNMRITCSTLWTSEEVQGVSPFIHPCVKHTLIFIWDMKALSDVYIFNTDLGTCSECPSNNNGCRWVCSAANS